MELNYINETPIKGDLSFFEDTNNFDSDDIPYNNNFFDMFDIVDIEYDSSDLLDISDEIFDEFYDKKTIIKFPKRKRNEDLDGFKCPNCNKTFKGQSGLHYHLNRSNTECKKNYQNPNKLKKKKKKIK